MAGKRLGIVYIKVAGAMLESLPGATLDMGGQVRSPVIGANAVLGFSVALKEATVECEISVGANTDLRALAAIEDVTVTFECDTGQTYVVARAALSEPPKITAGEGGKVPLKFFGQPAIQMGAA